MKAKTHHTKLTAAALLLLYIFITTPALLWHQHSAGDNTAYVCASAKTTAFVKAGQLLCTTCTYQHTAAHTTAVHHYFLQDVSTYGSYILYLLPAYKVLVVPVLLGRGPPVLV